MCVIDSRENDQSKGPDGRTVPAESVRKCASGDCNGAMASALQLSVRIGAQATVPCRASSLGIRDAPLAAAMSTWDARISAMRGPASTGRPLRSTTRQLGVAMRSCAARSTGSENQSASGCRGTSGGCRPPTPAVKEQPPGKWRTGERKSVPSKSKTATRSHGPRFSRSWFIQTFCSLNHLESFCPGRAIALVLDGGSDSVSFSMERE